MPDWDDVFGYYTVKYVKIRDRYLGFTQKALMLAIFGKILGYAMFYSCQHLQPIPVFGSARMNAQQPTKDSCNPHDEECLSDFTPLSELKYCSESNDRMQEEEAAARILVKPDAEEDGKSERQLRIVPQAHCVYWDAPTMTRGRSPVPGTLFVPTRVHETRQKKGCTPDASNKFSCETKPWVRDGSRVDSYYYVADVERFTVLLNQAFEADYKGPFRSGAASDFDGFSEGRPDLQSFFTKRKGYIKKLEKKMADDLAAAHTEQPIPDKPNPDGDFPSAMGLQVGDIFSIGDVLKMADLRGEDLLDEVRADYKTMRSAGAVISIDVEYSNQKNMDWLGSEEPHYTISAKYLPMKAYKIEYETMIDENTRTTHNVHGLLFIITVKGYIHTFSLTYLLTFLTTALVSITMASTITDYAMSYCFSMSDHYDLLKYQPSMDFSTVRTHMSELKQSKGKDYDPARNKYSAIANTMFELAEAKRAPNDQELLAVLCSFEQRLSRIDAVDYVTASGLKDMPGGDPCSNVVRDFKNEFSKKSGFPSLQPVE